MVAHHPVLSGTSSLGMALFSTLLENARATIAAVVAARIRRIARPTAGVDTVVHGELRMFALTFKRNSKEVRR